MVEKLVQDANGGFTTVDTEAAEPERIPEDQIGQPADTAPAVRPPQFTAATMQDPPPPTDADLWHPDKFPGHIKAWVRREITLQMSGHDLSERQRLNP